MDTLILRRTRGLAGPAFQAVAGGLARGVGNAFGAGGALSGVRPASAVAASATTLTVHFTACATVVLVSGVEVQRDGGAWTPATAVTGSPGRALTFTVPTMTAGEVLRVRGAAGALTDCETPAQDVPAWELGAQNPLVLAGNFVLLETRGADTLLLEAPENEGILLEPLP